MLLFHLDIVCSVGSGFAWQLVGKRDGVSGWLCMHYVVREFEIPTVVTPCHLPSHSALFPSPPSLLMLVPRHPRTIFRPLPSFEGCGLIST